MNLILLGAPGAGKGTQSAKISEKYGIPAIATGDILRGAIKAGTELGKSAKSYIDAGQLVPDAVVIGIIKDYLSTDSCKNGFILDGFPRSIPQAEALDAMGVRIDCVLNIEVPDEAIVSRMSGRRVCSCGASYHVEYNPTAVPGICDRCGAKTTRRTDDDKEIVKERLSVYHHDTEPVKKYYERQNKLKIVVGQKKVEDTQRLVAQAVGVSL